MQLEGNSKYKYTIGWPETGILLGGYFVSGVVLALIIGYYTYILKQDFETSSLFLMVSYVLTLGLPILAFDLFVVRPKGKKLNFKFPSSSAITYISIFTMMFGMMLISEYLTSLLPTTGPIIGDLYKSFVSQMDSISLDSVALIIMVAVFAPLLEEILFRGIILKGMLNKGMNPKKAIFFSALIFGAIHGYPWQFLGAFFLGLVMGLVYWKTNNLLLTILMHAFNNFIAAMFMLYSNEDTFNQFINLPEYFIFALGIAIFGVSYYLFMNRNKVDSFLKF